MPVERRVRAYIVAGLAVYIWAFSEPRDALLSAPAAWALAVALQFCVGLGCIARRRRKPGALLLAGALVTAAFAVVWSGRRLLRNEWFSAFLSW